MWRPKNPAAAAAETLRYAQGDILPLFHWLELQPIDILTILHADRLPAGFHLHPHFQLIDRIGFDLSHGFDVVLKFSHPDDEVALIEAPRQVEDGRVGEEFGIPFGFDLLELAAFARQAAIMDRDSGSCRTSCTCKP